MRPRMGRTLLVASVAAGTVALRRRRAPRTSPDRVADADRARWRVVTVNRPPEDVAPDGRVPEPLGELGDSVEVEIRRAPGDRGTELAARLRAGEPTGPSAAVARITGDDPRQAVRTALREAKQLIETGEVLSPHQPPTTERTLLGRPLELATRRARGEGRL